MLVYPSVQKFNLIFNEYDDFIAVYKPEGFRTHKVSENQWGFVETLSASLRRPLWVVHRLDKDTSGVILFAKSKDAAAQLSSLFESHQINKTYYFLTDKKADFKSIKVNSLIEKNDHSFVSIKSETPNSETAFECVKSAGALQLWKAQPRTGKPHQIRLHAQDVGLAILGDKEHGGSDFYRLCLHAAELEFNWKSEVIKLSAPLPPSFDRQQSSLFDYFSDHWFRLAQIYSWDCAQSFRLIDFSESEIVADIYGETLWVYWYKKTEPTENDVAEIKKFSDEKKLQFVIRHMINRGQGVSDKDQKKIIHSQSQPSTWVASENNLKALLKTDAGFSPGLFLDQSVNRQWVFENSHHKKVLNLFSYTSIFSVAAALGQARQVTTVDASISFLNWSKENFTLNSVDPAKHEFFVQDCVLFLNGSIKRKRQWDLIICDPPSFGRTKTTVWKIEKNLPELAKGLWASLAPQGQLLFTCNYENWDLDELKDVFKKTLKGQKFEIQNLPPNTMDFGFYDEKKNPTKGFFLRKN